MIKCPPSIMAILNVTPDSFSDGGRFTDIDDAVARGLELAAQGADVIDVGGESTRPGSQRVDPDEQIRRTADIIAALRQALDRRYPHVQISIDTTRAAVARTALERGSSILNDVSAGTDDPEMFALAAQFGVPLILMHMRGQPADMQNEPTYDDVVAQVLDYLNERADAAQAAGVARDKIWIDPGIGFGKTKIHNLQLLAALDQFVATGYPVLLGTSRKRFMGAIVTPPDATTAPQPDELIGATCATTVLGTLAGVHMFRVHDVTPNRQAALVTAAIRDISI